MSGHSTTDNELMVVNPRHLLLSMAFAVIILLVLLPYPAAMLFVATHPELSIAGIYATYIAAIAVIGVATLLACWLPEW
jgi:hypothetical protein